MARTDKTRPGWVQMLDPTNRGWLEVWHDHTRGPYRRPLDGCDLAASSVRGYPLYRSRGCTMWPSRVAAHEGVYPRPGKHVEWYAYGNRRRERAAWRALRTRLLAGDLDAADESPLTYSHRHEALWDAY